MLSADEVISRIQDPQVNLAAMSRESGLPYGTLTKIRQGGTPDPRKSTLDRARTYFERLDSAMHGRRRGQGRAAA